MYDAHDTANNECKYLMYGVCETLCISVHFKSYTVVYVLLHKLNIECGCYEEETKIMG
jgi:hypothetical protein